MDQTLAIALLAAASIGIGIWDVWGKARDVLAVVGLAELALVAGVALETLFPGGFAVSVIASWVLGAKGVARVEASREAELEFALEQAPDSASRLLVLHDRMDRRRLDGTVAEKTMAFAGLWVLALVAVGLIAMGLTYDSWQVLLAGVGIAFLPVGQAAKAITAGEERRQVEALISGSSAPPQPPLIS